MTKLNMMQDYLSIIKDQRQILRLVIYAIMLCYPVTIFIVEWSRSNYFALLVLLSLIALGINKCRYENINLGRLDIWFLTSLILLFFVAFISWAYFGFTVGEKRMIKHSWFLFAIPVFFMLRHVRPRVEIIWIGIVIGCYVAFGRAVLEELNLVQEFRPDGIRLNRANGVMHPIRFGNIALLMGFIALAGSLYLPSQPRILRLLGLLAFPAALIASVLSQSRGGWIAIPLLMLIVLWPYVSRQSKKIRFLIPSAIIAILLVSSVMPGSKVAPRFEKAISEVQMYTQGTKMNSSIATRFFMFEAAWNIFKNNPVFGVGIGNYRAHAIAYYKAQKPEIGEYFMKWKNPHNEFLLHAATRGLVGLSTLLFVFAMGFYYFFRSRILNRNCEFAAISGMLLVAAYMQFGLSIALFEHRDFLAFFVIYLIMFFATATPLGESQDGKV